MTRHVMLDNVTYKDLRVIRDYARVPAYDVNVARVFPSEFIQLQMEYPLFFLRNKEAGNFEPIALLGFSDKENLYLDETGWDAGYVPLSIERGPFLIGFQERDVDGVPTRAPVVHIDLDHPGVSETEGERVFLPHGGESPLLERISSVLMMIHQGHEAAKSLSEMLVGLDLIESLALEVELRGRFEAEPQGSLHDQRRQVARPERECAGVASQAGPHSGRLHDARVTAECVEAHR